MQRKRPQRGFTLIELLIVVVIMSVVGATVVGTVMRKRSQSRQQSKGQVVARQAVAQTPLVVQRLLPQEDGTVRLGALIQSVVSSVIDARLNVDYLLDKGVVIPVYHAQFEATYHLRNPLFSSLPARIFFPFPKGAGTFSALEFRAARAGQACSPKAATQPFSIRGAVSSPENTPLDCKLQEPRQHLEMSPQGIAWRYPFAAQEEIKIVVRYQVRGRDQYQYQIAAGKKRQFRFKMHITGVDPLIPPSALQPSQMRRLLEPQHHLALWDFRDFITSEAIEIRFPPEYAKFHRFSLLGRLAWIALLIFAILFWYFGERERGEAMHSNNLTRFNIALVGVGFVSFFPLFLYLEEHLTMRWAFWLGITCATSLTTIHVSLFMGLRWALLRSLPIQLLVTLSFTAAVLFPAYRTLIITLSALLLTVALIILNARYQREARIQAAREAEEKEREAAKQRRIEEEQRRLIERERFRLEVMAEGEEGQKKTVDPSQLSFGEEASTRPLSAKKDREAIVTLPMSSLQKTCHCMYCKATVEKHHKHCYACGAFLQRDYACPSCHTLYWYPAVSSFRFCRSCGGSIFPPPDPTPPAK